MNFLFALGLNMFYNPKHLTQNCPATRKLDFENAWQVVQGNNITIGFSSSLFPQQNNTLNIAQESKSIFEAQNILNSEFLDSLCPAFIIAGKIDSDQPQSGLDRNYAYLPGATLYPIFDPKTYSNDTIMKQIDILISTKNELGKGTSKPLSIKPAIEDYFSIFSHKGRNSKGIPIFYSAHASVLTSDVVSRYVNLIGLSSCEYSAEKSVLSGVFPNLLINAPSTCHFANSEIRNSGNAAFAAAATALMLEINPKLTWRDIQYILALTAVVNDYGPGSKWMKNAAGIYYSLLYGFGRLNAGLAIKIAKDWENIPPEANTVCKFPKRLSLPHSLEDPLEIQLSPNPVSNGRVKTIEYVELSFSLHVQGSHACDGLMVQLESPSGTVITLKYPDSNVQSGGKVTLGTRGFFLETQTAKGNWTLRMKSMLYNPFLQVSDVTLNLYGTSQELFVNNFLQKTGKTKIEKRPISDEKTSSDFTTITCSNSLNKLESNGKSNKNSNEKSNDKKNDKTAGEKNSNLRKVETYETIYFKDPSGSYVEMRNDGTVPCFVRNQTKGEIIYLNHGNREEHVMKNVIIENSHVEEVSIFPYQPLERTQNYEIQYFRQNAPSYLGINQNMALYSLYIHDIDNTAFSDLKKDDGKINIRGDKTRGVVSIESWGFSSSAKRSVFSLVLVNDDIYQCPLVLPLGFANYGKNFDSPDLFPTFKLKINQGRCPIPHGFQLDRQKFNGPSRTMEPANTAFPDRSKSTVSVILMLIVFVSIIVGVSVFVRVQEDETRHMNPGTQMLEEELVDVLENYENACSDSDQDLFGIDEQDSNE